MYRIGGRAIATGLGASCGVLLTVAVLSGCGSSASGSRPDPPTTTASSQQQAGPKRAVVKNPSLPGHDVSKSRDGAGDLRRVSFHSRALGTTDSYLIYLPPG